MHIILTAFWVWSWHGSAWATHIQTHGESWEHLKAWGDAGYNATMDYGNVSHRLTLNERTVWEGTVTLLPWRVSHLPLTNNAFTEHTHTHTGVCCPQVVESILGQVDWIQSPNRPVNEGLKSLLFKSSWCDSEAMAETLYTDNRETFVCVGRVPPQAM